MRVYLVPGEGPLFNPGQRHPSLGVLCVTQSLFLGHPDQGLPEEIPHGLSFEVPRKRSPLCLHHASSVLFTLLCNGLVDGGERTGIVDDVSDGIAFDGFTVAVGAGPVVLEGVEHGVAESGEITNVGDEAAAGPLAAVVHVSSVLKIVVLVTDVIPGIAACLYSLRCFDV